MNHLCQIVPATTMAASALLAVAVLTWHSSVAACSSAPPEPVLSGVPADGDVDIPTDVVPIYSWFSGDFLGLSSMRFELVSAAGDAIDVTPRFTADALELRPARNLEPFTDYTLNGQWEANGYREIDVALRFTTGGAPSASASTPQASLLHYQIRRDSWDSCSAAPFGTCVALASGQVVIGTFTNEFGEPTGPSRTFFESFLTNLSGFEQFNNEHCLILRTRSWNGTQSAPLLLCGEDGRRFLVDGTADTDVACTSEGLTQDGHLVETEGEFTGSADPTSGTSEPLDPFPDTTLGADGCACSAAGATRAPSGSLMLVLASLFTFTLRRTRRTSLPSS